ELNGFDEYLLSGAAEPLAAGARFRSVPDIYPGRGPMGGLHALLHAARADTLLVLPCDMPLYEKRLGDFLLSFLGGALDAWICRTRDGRLHPLCGVYTRACLPVIEDCIAEGRLSLMEIFPRVRSRFVDTAEADIPDDMFFNVNTPEDYERLRQRQ
ncbi:MAG: molybdenum cofactor guanylyltransferase, partial [Clostridia bacterium]|nr:molybdenum cofactor guanylyltransferase [Clostridia bacterium]